MNNNFQVYTSRDCSGMDFETYAECEAFIKQEKLNVIDEEINYEELSGEPTLGWIDCRYAI